MTSPIPRPATFDPASALANLDNDTDLLSAVFDAFRDDSPRMLAAMQRAVESGDGGALKLVSHEFKGAVSNFSEPRTVELALALEVMADRGALAGAEAILAQLRIAVEQLQALFAEFLVQPPACAS